MRTVQFITILAALTNLASSGMLEPDKEIALLEPEATSTLPDKLITNAFGWVNLTGISINGVDKPTSIKDDTANNAVIYYYDSLNITGDYSAAGWLFYFLPLFGDGNLNFEAKNVTITATGEPGSYTMSYYVVTFNAFFQNFLGGGIMGVVGEALKLPPVLAVIIFKNYETDISAIINSLVANNEL